MKGMATISALAAASARRSCYLNALPKKPPTKEQYEQLKSLKKSFTLASKVEQNSYVIETRKSSDCDIGSNNPNSQDGHPQQNSKCASQNTDEENQESQQKHQPVTSSVPSSQSF